MRKLKSTIKRRKSTRRKRMMRNMRRIPTRTNFLQTKRFVIPIILNGSDAVPANVGIQSFAFSDIPAYTEFTNAFDAYKLAGIRYRWIVIRSADQTGLTVNGTLGIYTRVMWAYDYNDGAAPSGVSDVQQYDNCKEVYLTNARPVSKWYFFKPKPLLTTLGGYTTVRRVPFLRINDTSTAHYGIKYYYDGNQASQQLRLEAYYYFQLKAVR